MLGSEEAKKYLKADEDRLKMLVEKEIEDANKDKITIDEFIQNGGSLEELIEK